MSSAGSMSQIAQAASSMGMANGHGHNNKEDMMMRQSSYFQMPLHYPRFTRADYEKMPEWKLDCLFTEYGLRVSGDLNYKRNFAMGAFLWQ